MKSITYLSLSFLIFGSYSVLGHDLAGQIGAARNSYETLARVQQWQMEHLSTLMDEYYKKAEQVRALNNSGPKAANLSMELGQLEFQIRDTSHMFHKNGFAVRASTGQVEDVLQMRRAQYMNMVQNLAKTDPATVKTMNLSKPILSDIQMARDLSHLSPENFKRAMLQYDGRTFGEVVTRPEEQARGVRERGKVEINTFHSRHTVEIMPRQIISGQTTAGAVVKGEVVGLLPDGRVIIKNIYDFGLSEAKPSLNGARIIDLNKLSTLKIYGDRGMAATGRPDVDLSVRLTNHEVVKAIRDGRLREITGRSTANGDYRNRNNVKDTVIDKRVGEVVPVRPFGGGSGGVR